MYTRSPLNAIFEINQANGSRKTGLLVAANLEANEKSSFLLSTAILFTINYTAFLPSNFLPSGWLNYLQFSTTIKGIHLYFSWYCERNSCLSICFFRLRLWLTCEGQKQKVAVRSRSNFFSYFGHFSGPFNPVFFLI